MEPNKSRRILTISICKAQKAILKKTILKSDKHEHLKNNIYLDTQHHNKPIERNPQAQDTTNSKTTRKLNKQLYNC